MDVHEVGINSSSIMFFHTAIHRRFAMSISLTREGLFARVVLIRHFFTPSFQGTLFLVDIHASFISFINETHQIKNIIELNNYFDS